MGLGSLWRGLRNRRRSAGLRYLGLGLVVLFVAFELAHPVGDLLHYNSHRHTLACNGSAQDIPPSESGVLDAHGPFLLLPAPQLRPPTARWLILQSTDASPESSSRALPDPVPILG